MKSNHKNDLKKEYKFDKQNSSKMKVSKSIKDNIKTLISYLFILLFVYAAVSKLLDFQKFRIQVGQSPILVSMGTWIVIVVPIIEILISVCFLIPKFRLKAMYGALILMTIFTTYIIFILNFSPYVPCSCGGILDKMGWGEHLIFNLFFVFLAIFGTLLLESENKLFTNKYQFKFMKSTYIKISICLISGILIVSLLYGLSDKLTHKSNSFHRYFTFHPVTPVRGIDLEYNSYYISGVDSNRVYLGNITAPLHLLKLKLPEMDTSRLQLTVEQSNGVKLRRNSMVSVKEPYFYIADGYTPKVLRGEIGKWHAQSFMYDSAYFSNAIPIGSKSLAIRSLSSDTKEYVLGKETDSFPYVKLVPGILEKQLDGLFCTDGMLHYNRELSKLIYLYYYRNQYIVMDTTLLVVYKGNTIDTNNLAKINPTKIKSENTRILGSPPLMVNKKSCTSGNVLLVHSNLMAKNEDPKTFSETSVIDVYNIIDGRYEFSFYIYPYNDKKLTDFYLTRNHFIAIHDRYLVIYALNPKVFDQSIMSSFNTSSFKEL